MVEVTPDAATFIAKPKLRWGAVKSYRHGDQQDQLLATLHAAARVDEAKDSQELFEWLKAGKVQAIFAQSVIYSFYLRQLNFGDKMAVRDWTPLEKPVHAHLVFSKKHFTEAEALAWSNLLENVKCASQKRSLRCQRLRSPW